MVLIIDPDDQYIEMAIANPRGIRSSSRSSGFNRSESKETEIKEWGSSKDNSLISSID